ncbi:BON1-associated protein 2 [Canna indica]|uniref:BON1-associated protein 2 n=1 Tax=Canna indica TaxID=4628 RepID=A0AAQ3KVR8_9LILI|nr:BON1-associated protein 2 [Canna indica]
MEGNKSQSYRDAEGDRSRSRRDIMENAITIISAKELRLRHRQIKKGAFAVVRSCRDKATTKVNFDGGSYPYWDEKLSMTLPSTASQIAVEVHCITGGAGALPVAAAMVPVSDFRCLEDYQHCLSYRLRDIISGVRGVHWALPRWNEEEGGHVVGYPIGWY